MNVTRKQVGLKPNPIIGGPNSALLPAGTPVTIDPTWSRITAPQAGWLHAADIGPAPEPCALGIYAINTAAGQWREDWASGQKARTGVAPGIIHRYQPWTGAAWSPWDTAWATDAAILGTMPLVSWEGRDYTVASPTQASYSTAAVLAGKWDATLIPWLTDAGKWGQPFLLRFFWEMTGNFYPWAVNGNGNSPGQFIDAWRHIVRLQRTYAPLARTVWCPSVFLPPNAKLTPMADCYPGSDWVDVIGLDGYNTAILNWTGPDTSFHDVFAASVAEAQRIDVAKPILICETGVNRAAPGVDSVAWLLGIPDALKQLPAVRGVVFFDNTDASADFTIHSEPQKTAMATIQQDTYLRGAWR